MAEAAAMGVTRAAQELRITIDFGAIRLARLPRSGLPLIYQFLQLVQKVGCSYAC